MKNKDRFLKIFADLSIDVRREIILLMDGQPITWNVAFAEIDNETKLGGRILQKLVEMEMI